MVVLVLSSWVESEDVCVSSWVEVSKGYGMVVVGKGHVSSSVIMVVGVLDHMTSPMSDQLVVLLWL